MSQQISRRAFMMGCSAAIAGLAGARLTKLAFAAPSAPYNDEIVVVLFLRGGWDALNVVPPIAGVDRGYYEAARPYLKIPLTGASKALPLNSQFGLNPAMAPLLNLYQANKLAVVHAAGLTYDTRSHFDAQDFIELGTPGVKSTTTGWITRHMQTAPNLPPTILMPVIADGSGVPTSLLGDTDVAAMSSPTDFSFSANWRYGSDQRTALRNMYAGDTWLDTAGTQTLNAIDIVEAISPSAYVPANGATYPTSDLGRSLITCAQMIKLNVGLRVVTIDVGGWDTHQYEGDGGVGYIGGLLGDLAQSLAAFYLDMDGSSTQNYTYRMTVVAMSEFGRRFRENADHGTDHGHGSVMLVLGGGVNGGQVYTDWPGLSIAQLYDGDDLAVTTDYRRVLSDIVVNRLGNPNIAAVFPGYTGYTPMNIVRTREYHSTYVPLIQR